MSTTKQVFQIKKEGGTYADAFEVTHKPALLNIDYFIDFKDCKTGEKVSICLYNLRSIMRTANKNIKEIMEANLYGA